MNSAVLYVRVSTAEQAKQQYNLPAQQAKLKEYCSRNSLSVLKMFVDRGESARTANRPEFQNLLEYCRENRRKISHVIVADLSRLARNIIDQGTTIVTLKQFGITLISVDEPITDDTAAGKLARNMLGSFNQFFSDSLSERTKYRMQAAVKAGRFPWPSPIGYLNVEKNLAVDPQRAPLVCKAFELMGSGSYTTGDAVLRQITAMGLKTKKGSPLTKQSFHRLLTNPIYIGWVVSGENRVRGTHEPLVPESLFESVQDRLNGKSAPHKRLNEDFPLRGIVRCAKCGKPLTAGWAKGRTERYARYWCWQKGCRAVGVSRDDLEFQFVSLLGRMQPTADLLAQLPEIAAREWQTRKTRIAKDAETLTKRLADQRTLNQKAIMAKLNGELSADDFDVLKKNITEEIFKIEGEISTLDAERCTMEELISQTKVQVVNLAEAWSTGNVNQKQELARAFFPDGLVFSPELHFFEPGNLELFEMLTRWISDPSNVGVPDGI